MDLSQQEKGIKTSRTILLVPPVLGDLIACMLATVPKRSLKRNEVEIIFDIHL